MTASTRPPTAPLRWWEIDRLVALEEQLFPTDSPWTAAMFFAELAAGHHYCVVRDGDTVLGYGGVALLADDEAEIQTIGVDPRVQGRGLGRLLLADLLEHAAGRRVFLEIRTDNLPALTLYESVGFTRIGLRRRYYQPSGADAYTMERPTR